MVGEKRTVSTSTRSYKYFKAKQGKRPVSQPSTKKRPSENTTTYSRKRAYAGSRSSYANTPWRKAQYSAHTHNAITNKKKLLNVPGAMGEYVPLSTIFRSTFIAPNNDHSFYLVIFETGSDVVGMQVWGETGYTMPFATSQLATAAPVSTRPMRLSVSIRNITKADSVQGCIRCISTPQHFKLAFQEDSQSAYLTTANLNSLKALMSGAPEVRSVSAQSLCIGGAIHAPPASQTTFKTFKEFIQYDASSAAARHTSNSIFNRANVDMVSNMIIIELVHQDLANQYDIAVHRQVAARFPHDNILSNLAQSHNVPGNQQQFDASVAAAQARASSNPVVPFG